MEFIVDLKCHLNLFLTKAAKKEKEKEKKKPFGELINFSKTNSPNSIKQMPMSLFISNEQMRCSPTNPLA